MLGSEDTDSMQQEQFLWPVIDVDTGDDAISRRKDHR